MDIGGFGMGFRFGGWTVGGRGGFGMGEGWGGDWLWEGDGTESYLIS